MNKRIAPGTDAVACAKREEEGLRAPMAGEAIENEPLQMLVCLDENEGIGGEMQDYILREAMGKMAMRLRPGVRYVVQYEWDSRFSTAYPIALRVTAARESSSQLKEEAEQGGE